MNILAIDYGTKHIGLAYSVQGIISPLTSIPNNQDLFENIKSLVKDYKIEKIYVGMSEGRIAKLTKRFVSQLLDMLELPIETVEESVSTIEATEIFITNKKNKKDYKKLIDSVSAAVILRRVINL